MTRLNLLEDQKVILTANKELLKTKVDEIGKREKQAISDALLPFFSDFPSDLDIEVNRGSIYFIMDHPDLSYKKEIFTLYLREKYSVEDVVTFTGIDLSYYSTQTKGDDIWELRRLHMLGKVAEILEVRQSWVVLAANQAVLPFKAEYKEVYDKMYEIRKELRGVEDLIRVVEKEKIEFDLKNDGVQFERGRNIQLKFNYSPNVKAIKLVDFNKSGKKCSVVFEFSHGGGSSREENCSVNSIIDQVYGLRNDIVQPTLAE
jgi:hypothetical protein